MVHELLDNHLAQTLNHNASYEVIKFRRQVTKGKSVQKVYRDFSLYFVLSIGDLACSNHRVGNQ